MIRIRSALLVLAATSIAPAHAQCWWQQPPISTAADGAESVYATDLDGDGDADVLSASDYDDKIAWYENLGGGTFGPQQVITTSANQPYSVYAADLDGDGDADVLSASSVDDKIAWYEKFTGIGVRYCSPASPNSTSESGSISVTGSLVLFLNEVDLTARSLSLNSSGYFITSRTQGYTYPVGNSQGALCVQGLVGRYVGPGQILNSGSTGTFTLPINVNAMPTPTGLVQALPGETWNFQAWHRDANPTLTSNFTDAVSVTFQ
jgi:hypothetical protein